jgi:hypothetical protein
MVLAAAFFIAPAPSEAQLADASASGLALSGNNTAIVRGFGALSVNPAGLAMPGSGFSLALAPIQVRAGLGPVTLRDLAEYEGLPLPRSTKDLWLSAIAAAGGQSGAVGADVSAFALTIRNLGFQMSTVASASLALPTDLVEAALYGNAGRTGDPTDLQLAGLRVDAFAITTGAVSLGFPAGPATLGVTGKYMVGNGVGVMRAGSGAFTTDPLRLTLDAPIVATCDDEVVGACTQDYTGGGTGYGIDLGFMMDLSALAIGASIQNVLNTFAWNPTTLSYRAGAVLVEEGSSSSDYDETPLSFAPASLTQLVDDLTIKPSIRIGAALSLPMGLTVTGDIHRRLSDEGMAFGPKDHTGVGAEFRGLKIVHLRAGAAVITGGTQYSAGASLVLGPVNLSLAGAIQQVDTLNETVFGQFTLSFGNR